ncbi:MAG: hemerythrin domain-containing protein, partial [Betaproteobacteria bacterium]
MASKKPAPRKSTPKHPVKDAVSMLMADHKKVKSLFSEFKKIAESKAKAAAARKQEIMDTVCDELTVHTTIEEEIYYPAARAAMPKEDALL